MGKREDILKSTLEIIVDEGLQSFNFAKLFKKANVGAGTIYNYFPNKENLINELYKSVAELMSNYVLNGYNSNATIDERIYFFMNKIIEFFFEYPKHLWFLENYTHSPYIDEKIRNATLPAMEAFFACLQEGQTKGLIKNINPILCLEVLSGILLSSVKGHFNKKYVLGTKEIEQVIDCCKSAIMIY